MQKKKQRNFGVQGHGPESPKTEQIRYIQVFKSRVSVRDQNISTKADLSSHPD